ncbi:response regulator [Lachnospiraceae bacterium WCA-9-b2]|jgi:signal transduction histidine kinase|uniref:Circadian input-output histidine kinase CikA n=1 Tax=Sporofaciens musculi TaxID=2681861 RepID=A0A7X3MKB0_9FIRM|nr:ATP-binding protein [Sporofaciens musculi]MXP78004.1 response regulator [Sporofaciens musculi]
MNIEEKKSSIRYRGIWDGPLLLILIMVVVMVTVSGRYLRFLDAQLFEERKGHIIEFTEKAAEIVDSVITYSWQQVYACEHMLNMKAITSKEDLMDSVASTTDFIDETSSLVFAFDREGNYYCSDRKQGVWQQTEILSADAKEKQQLVVMVPHRDDIIYFLCIERLREPIALQDGSGEITHLAVAVDLGAVQEKTTVKGFGENCYTYLINGDGMWLFKYTFANGFIEENNVMASVEDCEIIHGGLMEDFVREVKEKGHAALEFKYTQEDGTEQRWYVANATVTAENWHVLLFVPTAVLGADSDILLERTLRFFSLVFIVFLAMTIIIIIVVMMGRADKQLVQQKEEANQLLLNAAEEAKSASQAKSDFLSHMSHDIRTPINGIMGMTDIAMKNIGNDDKIRDCLNKISGSSQHLLGLINDVLDMSRIESGKTRVKHESFDMRTCIDNCISIIGGQLATRDLEMVRKLSKFQHPCLIGDELHLRQIFINILGNSVKFTPDGGKIFFRAWEKESTDEKALYRFELADTGIGMKEEFLPHLFEAFAQEDDGTRTTYKGTGLGMAITKEFVELMGGTIEVESKLNVGTEFAIEIWFDIDQNARIGESMVDVQIDLVGMKVLLVEDIDLNMEIAQCMLEDEGAEVTPAMNGQEAVDAFSMNPSGTFDIIIMDIMMPVMDGITAAKTIRAMEREDAKTIPIIAMTANAYEEDIQKTHDAGMNAHLSKPIDIDLMLKTLAIFYSSSQEA